MQNSNNYSFGIEGIAIDRVMTSDGLPMGGLVSRL